MSTVRSARPIAVLIGLVLYGLALVGWGADGVQALGAKGRTEPQSVIIRLDQIAASGLQKPLYLTHAGDGTGRLFVLEQPGRIRIIRDRSLSKQPFLDITDRVSFGGERGLLGLAFHPGYAGNGRYFVNYTRAGDGATVVAEYRVSGDPDRSLMSQRTLLVVGQPYSNHNAGMIGFGPDGYLYVAMGDGGAGGDPGNRAQDRQNLLGKILRLDVDGKKPYGVPNDNPFVMGGGRPEIYAHGFRNPWRFSFDRRTGQLWVADVGQNDWEEVHVVERGKNYGWKVMEGTHCFAPETGCPRDAFELPVIEYPHQGGRCSVTGGYVYRGRAVPALAGTYLFGDFCSGEIFGFPGVDSLDKPGNAQASRPGSTTILLSTDLNISSFGEDEEGEVYVVGHGGTIHKILSAVAEPAASS